MFREAHGDDLNNGIKLLEASNKDYKVNITPNNSRYYQQNWSTTFSKTQNNLKNFSLKNNFSKNPLRDEATIVTVTQADVPAQKLEEQVRDIHLTFKKDNKTSTSKVFTSC